jgi:transposase
VRKKWVIPTVGAEFVWRMEEVLDLYAEPEDPQRPRVCFDEMPYQMIAETRSPLPMQAGQAECYDYEYRRMGTCNLFLFFNPFAGKRRIKVTQQRTKQDFAHCLKELVDEDYPDAIVIRVILDQLNTHTKAALYETFDPKEAHRIARKLEFHYTPKHGSWLNMAEIEFSVVDRQCLDRWLQDIETVQSEISAWELPRNQQNIGIDWQFTTEKARQKLERLYPPIS